MNNLLLANLTSIILYVVLGVMLVAMIVFPMFSNKKRQKQYSEMQNALRPGTRVMTIGRLIGKVVKVYSDNTIELDIGTEGNPVIIVVNREAIGVNLDAQPTPVNKTEKKEVKEKEPVITDAPVTEENAETATEAKSEEASAYKADDDAI